MECLIKATQPRLTCPLRHFGEVDRLDGSRAIGANRKLRFAIDTSWRDEDVIGSQKRDVISKTALHLLSDELGHGYWSQSMHEPAEEEQEQHESYRDKNPGDSDADVGNEVGLDTTQQRERERQGSDQRGQSALEHGVAVPEPHVPSREVPVAICTTRIVTVTTNPVSAAIAPMIADSTVLAVEGEYRHWAGRWAPWSILTTIRAPRRPSSTPASGSIQALEEILLNANAGRPGHLIAGLRRSRRTGVGHAAPCTCDPLGAASRLRPLTRYFTPCIVRNAVTTAIRTGALSKRPQGRHEGGDQHHRERRRYYRPARRQRAPLSQHRTSA